MLLISNNMHASADTNMTLTQDFCVRDCQHNHTTHNHNPAAPLLRHYRATNTHPATAAVNT
jgi:hypothetical protein